jgi:hypothetical protein
MSRYQLYRWVRGPQGRVRKIRSHRDSIPVRPARRSSYTNWTVSARSRHVLKRRLSSRSFPYTPSFLNSAARMRTIAVFVGLPWLEELVTPPRGRCVRKALCTCSVVRWMDMFAVVTRQLLWLYSVPNCLIAVWQAYLSRTITTDPLSPPKKSQYQIPYLVSVFGRRDRVCVC